LKIVTNFVYEICNILLHVCFVENVVYFWASSTDKIWKYPRWNYSELWDGFAI